MHFFPQSYFIYRNAIMGPLSHQFTALKGMFTIAYMRCLLRELKCNIVKRKKELVTMTVHLTFLSGCVGLLDGCAPGHKSQTWMGLTCNTLTNTSFPLIVEFPSEWLFTSYLLVIKVSQVYYHVLTVNKTSPGHFYLVSTASVSIVGQEGFNNDRQ